MMQIFDYVEFNQDMTKVFSAALADEVIINNKDETSYKLLPIKENNKVAKSPLEDIPRIKLDITMQEIVKLLQESRAGI
jgi:hypothetical protein